MLRRLIVAIAGWCFLALIVPANAAGAAEARSALIIGNAAYKEAPLKNPVNDAKAMATTLQRLGFQVVVLTDASKRQIEQAILAFGEVLKAGDAGLFYYAGHGVQVKGQNYLVPVDAEIASEAAVRVAAVPVDLVSEQMGEAANRVNVIILDACRDNPFERRLRGGSRGLAAMDAARGTLVAYATAPGSVALDGDGENGLYTGELLKALGEPNLKAEEVFKRVRANVVKRTRGKQTPWESSSLTGDFIFNLTTTGAPPAPTAGFDERQIELAYWHSIKDSPSPEAFKAYLEQYPKGSFATLAQLKLAELRRVFKPANPSVFAESVAPQAEGTFSQADDAIRKGLAAEERKDFAEAMRWYREAAEQEHPIAQYAIARLYGAGLGVSHDFVTALHWYRKAAEQGYSEAQFFTGAFYQLGSGAPQDYAEALRWYRKAAEQGHTGAQIMIATMYEDGQGVPKDLAQARAWYQKAADAGDERAKTKLKSVGSGGLLAQVGPAAAQDQAGPIGWWSRVTNRSGGMMREVLEVRPNGTYTTGICLLRAKLDWCSGKATPQLQGSYSLQSDNLALQNGLLLQQSLDAFSRPEAPRVDLTQGRPERYRWRITALADNPPTGRPPTRTLHLTGPNNETRQLREMGVQPGWGGR